MKIKVNSVELQSAVTAPGSKHILGVTSIHSTKIKGLNMHLSETALTVETPELAARGEFFVVPSANVKYAVAKIDDNKWVDYYSPTAPETVAVEEVSKRRQGRTAKADL